MPQRPVLGLGLGLLGLVAAAGDGEGLEVLPVLVVPAAGEGEGLLVSSFVASEGEGLLTEGLGLAAVPVVVVLSVDTVGELARVPSVVLSTSAAGEGLAGDVTLLLSSRGEGLGLTRVTRVEDGEGEGLLIVVVVVRDGEGLGLPDRGRDGGSSSSIAQCMAK